MCYVFQKILLVLGMIWRDAHLVQFTEDDEPGELPHYMVNSVMEFETINATMEKIIDDMHVVL